MNFLGSKRTQFSYFIDQKGHRKDTNLKRRHLSGWTKILCQGIYLKQGDTYLDANSVLSEKKCHPI